MIRWIFLAAVVVAIAAAAVVFQTSAANPTPPVPKSFPVAPSKPKGPEPKVVIDGDLTYRFDLKAQHTKFERDWVVKNQGKGDLELELEAPACVCTVAYLVEEGKKNAVVPPGGEVLLHLVWDTKTHIGKFKKHATLTTNDSEHGKFEFTAEGMVQPAIIVSVPNDTVNLMELTTDNESYEQTVAVYSPDRPDLKITSMSSSKPRVFVLSDEPFAEEDQRKFQAGNGRRVKIVVNRGLPPGPFREEVLLKTDHPLRPEVRLTLIGTMIGPISVVPAKLELKDVSSKTGTQRPLTLLVRGGRDVEFEVAKKPERLLVEISPPVRDKWLSRYQVNVTVPPGTPAGDIEDLIVLKTNHPYAPEIRIPVSILVSDRG